jgi:hypothetical protein
VHRNCGLGPVLPALRIFDSGMAQNLPSLAEGVVRVHGGVQTQVAGAEMPLHHPDSTLCPRHGE